MKKIVMAVVLALILVVLASVPVFAQSGGSIGTEVWFQNGTTAYKSIVYTEDPGIVHVWTYEPWTLHIIFLPLSAFPEQPEGYYGPWSYSSPPYAELLGDEGELADFFMPDEQYWYKFIVEALTPNCIQLKNNAIDELEAAKTGNKKVDKGVDKAIDRVEKSLEAKLWESNARLDSKHGNKVFDEEKAAVKELQKLIRGKHTPDGVKTVCGAVIDKLVLVDKLLAEIALEDAQAYAGTSDKVDREIAKSEAELVKAQEEADNGNYDNAIDHYKKAWKHAQLAIKHAT